MNLITNQSQLNDVLVAHAREIAEATFALVANASQAERETASEGKYKAKKKTKKKKKKQKETETERKKKKRNCRSYFCFGRKCQSS